MFPSILLKPSFLPIVTARILVCRHFFEGSYWHSSLSGLDFRRMVKPLLSFLLSLIGRSRSASVHHRHHRRHHRCCCRRFEFQIRFLDACFFCVFCLPGMNSANSSHRVAEDRCMTSLTLSELLDSVKLQSSLFAEHELCKLQYSSRCRGSLHEIVDSA